MIKPGSAYQLRKSGLGGVRGRRGVGEVVADLAHLGFEDLQAGRAGVGLGDLGPG